MRHGSSRAQLSVAVAFFVGTRVWILFGFEPLASDVTVYFTNAAYVADLGKTPYSRDLPIEFPPLAWWTMAAARQISGAAISNQAAAGEIAAARRSYARAWRMLMAAADAGAFACLLAIVRRRRPEVAAPAAIVYAACTAMLAHVLFDRLDAGLLLLLLAALYCWVRGAEAHDAARWWRRAAYALLGLGVAYKIIPILILPFWLLVELKGRDARRRVPLAIAIAFAGIVLPFGMQSLISGAGVFQFVTFHSDRGVQLESLFATIMAAGRAVGFRTALELWEGGVNLTGDLAPAMLAVSNVALVTTLGVLGYVSLRRFAQYDDFEAYRVACLAVAASVAVSRVFSPQYLIWALPLLILLSTEVCRTPRSWWTAAAAVVLIAGLTAWVFPHRYFNFRATPLGLEPMPVASSRITTAFVVLGIRNAFYLALVATLAVWLWRSRWRRHER